MSRTWRRGNRFGRRRRETQEQEQHRSKLGLEASRSHLPTCGAQVAALLLDGVLPGFIPLFATDGRPQG